ncbi:MAG: peptidoglycan editing factor PgeF [Oligoflexia bacterium]|nr:peptidoglycan editing factor PgeF [Oligoflexia bacterium]
MSSKKFKFRKSRAVAIFFDKNESLASIRKQHPELSAISTLKQVHGTDIHEAIEGQTTLPLGDGLWTARAQIGLCVHTADCIPLLLASPTHVMAIHAGWRGVAQGLPRLAVEKLKSLGNEIEQIECFMGPSIGPCHFEVGLDVAEQILKSIGESVSQLSKSEVVRPHPDSNKVFIDLPKVAETQLIGAGLSLENIQIMRDCTYCKPEKYFSYRRDGSASRLESLVFLSSPTK